MEENNRIAIGIVVYNPDQERFKVCLESIHKQIDKVYIFDNGNESIHIENGVKWIKEDGNKGLSYALNRIMDYAKEDGYEWLITLDQDSIVPDGMIRAFAEVIDKGSNIGIICPQVIDLRRSYMKVKDEPEIEEVNFCITSGSCISTAVWEKVGRFDEWLFIDLVDNDFCKRVVESGYHIIRLNNYVLNQEFGKIVPKSEKIQKFWIKVSNIMHNENFAKLSYKKIVDPKRIYYTNRNIIYVNRKLNRYGLVGYKENYNCNNYYGFWISFVIPSVLRADDKIEVIKAVIKGCRDGRKKTVNTWIANIEDENQNGYKKKNITSKS